MVLKYILVIRNYGNCCYDYNMTLLPFDVFTENFIIEGEDYVRYIGTPFDEEQLFRDYPASFGAINHTLDRIFNHNLLDVCHLEEQPEQKNQHNDPHSNNNNKDQDESRNDPMIGGIYFWS
jgi:hypothetical protein